MGRRGRDVALSTPQPCMATHSGEGPHKYGAPAPRPALQPLEPDQRDEPPKCGSDKQLHLHPGDATSCWELRLHASRACAQTHLPQDPAQKQQFEKHIDHM